MATAMRVVTLSASQHNALVWLDTRTAALVDREAERRGGVDALRAQTGLPIATYFSALKVRWLAENVPAVADALASGDALIGTVDSWLIWCAAFWGCATAALSKRLNNGCARDRNLTGGAKNGGVHVTDVSNASRTLLMDLATCEWDDELLRSFDVPRSALPAIKSSSEVYGKIHEPDNELLHGVPVAGCLGDQQAALVGQRCFAAGEAKNTYATL